MGSSRPETLRLSSARYVGEAQAHGASADHVQGPNGASVTWNYGKNSSFFSLAQEQFLSSVATSGYDKGNQKAAPGTIILGLGSDPKKVRKAALTLVKRERGSNRSQKGDPPTSKKLLGNCPSRRFICKARREVALAVGVKFFSSQRRGGQHYCKNCRRTRRCTFEAAQHDGGAIPGTPSECCAE